MHAGSLTSGFLWSRWRGKRSRHSRRMRNPQFHVSGKRPMRPIEKPFPTLVMTGIVDELKLRRRNLFVVVFIWNNPVYIFVIHNKTVDILQTTFSNVISMAILVQLIKFRWNVFLTLVHAGNIIWPGVVRWLRHVIMIMTSKLYLLRRCYWSNIIPVNFLGANRRERIAVVLSGFNDWTGRVTWYELESQNHVADHNHQ